MLAKIFHPRSGCPIFPLGHTVIRPASSTAAPFPSYNYWACRHVAIYKRRALTLPGPYTHQAGRQYFWTSVSRARRRGSCDASARQPSAVAIDQQVCQSSQLMFAESSAQPTAQLWKLSTSVFMHVDLKAAVSVLAPFLLRPNLPVSYRGTRP